MKNTLRRVLGKLQYVTFAFACIAAPLVAVGQAPYMVKDINPGAASGLSTIFTNTPVSVGGTAFFGACDGSHGFELWKSNGTAQGTVLVHDSDPTTTGCSTLDDLLSAPRLAGDLNGKLLYRPNGFAGPHLSEIWRSDGTSAGTSLLLAVGTPSSIDIGPVSGGPATQFFWAGNTLMRSDGTPAGTASVLTSSSVSQSALAYVNGTVLYAEGGDPFTLACELWGTDGSSATPSLLRSFCGGLRFGIGLDDLRVALLGNSLFFPAEGGGGQVLWKTDGTPAGTALVKGFGSIPGTGGSLLDSLTNVGGTLYFWALADISFTRADYQLWKSDGTTAGTVLLTTAQIGTASAPQPSITGAIRTIADLNGLALFTANDGYLIGPIGAELWRSDGTAAGTVMVRDINPTGSSDPLDLTVINGLAYFSADDGSSGRELWRSDGTAAGTQRVADINPGAAGSNPDRFTNINGALYFYASDGVHGHELWALKAGSAPKSKCASKKMTAIAQRALDAAKCYSKGSAKGAAVDATCLAKAGNKFASAVAKAEAGTDCTTTGDGVALVSTIDTFVNAAVTSITGGAAGPSKCDSKKITAAGTEASNKAKCYAKAASSGKALDLTCLSKQETKLASAFAKAEIAGGCGAVGNAGAIESQVTTFVGTAVGPLVP